MTRALAVVNGSTSNVTPRSSAPVCVVVGRRHRGGWSYRYGAPAHAVAPERWPSPTTTLWQLIAGEVTRRAV